jgi:hypothetical protein
VRFTARVVGMLGAIVASLVLYVSDGAGYQTADYDRIFYIVAGPDCGFHGIEFGNEVMIVREPDARLIVHELGHTFGLPHAGASAVCGTWCVTQEQGDLFSPMGIGFTDFSAYEKEQLGWIPASRASRIPATTSSTR